MIKLGLKVWSVNKPYREIALRFFEKGLFDYLEIYAVPGSLSEWSPFWKGLPFPAVIHAPHFRDGINFASRENKTENFKIAREALRFADALNSQKVIFHPGVSGDTKETACQMKELNDPRILIENKPYFSRKGNLICNGYSPEEIALLKEETGYGFCLDIGHAFCAANALKIEPMEFLHRMNSHNPAMYHLTDGNYQGLYDLHDRHFGKGNFPLKEILNFFPENAMVTNESLKDSPENLDDFEKDVVYLRSL
jgi:deoxyribonuclease-4